ncbi:MAG: hypothetical protein AAF652_03260, partial [Cyanobacteria bacterium P01_C01_bin.72]
NFLVKTFSMFDNYSDIEKVKPLPYKAFKLKIINEIKMDKVELCNAIQKSDRPDLQKSDRLTKTKQKLNRS